MTAYAPCTGSFKAAVNTRKVNSAGLGSKFRHMHGKVYGACADCGRTGLVVRSDGTAPGHKAQAQAQDINMWGTPRALVNADEFCPDCEREVPRHYDSCPEYRR